MTHVTVDALTALESPEEYRECRCIRRGDYEDVRYCPAHYNGPCVIPVAEVSAEDSEEVSGEECPF